MARLSGLQRVMEVGMIISCAVSFFILVALATFHPADPGWSQAGLQPDVKNMVGPVGAYVADVLLFIFGITAYLVPFVLAFMGWFIFLHIKSLTELDYLTIALRLIGILLLVFGFTGIASINFDDFYSVSAGGAMGDIISNALIPHFSFVGSVLLLLCFFCTGFTLATGISWFQLVDSIGASVVFSSKKVFALPHKISTLSLPKPKPSDNENEQTKSIKEDGQVKITSLRAEPPAAKKQEPSFSIPEEVLQKVWDKSGVESELAETRIKNATSTQVEAVKPQSVDAAVTSSALKIWEILIYEKHWWTHYFYLLISCFPVFVLYYALYLSKLVPKIISIFGIIAVFIMKRRT